MTKQRIAILGNADGWYVRDLMRAANHETIEVVGFRELTAELGAGQVVLGSRTSDEQAQQRWLSGSNRDFDAVLVRTMPFGSLEQIIFRMNALHAAARQGTRIFNSPRCLEMAIDKWLTLDILQTAGLPVPRTICCQSRSDALEAFEKLGRDCVVKPIFGGEGRGIMRVDDPDLAWRVFGSLEQLGAVLYLQEFLPHNGFDLRLLVIGKEIFSVRRFGNGDWRTNVSRGGHAEPVNPTPAQLAMARQAADAIGGMMVGVDILPATDGRDVLIEVNAVPGWRGTGAALGVDIARKVLDQLFI
jgi:RimK family alpha-L-glutamate ligase